MIQKKKKAGKVGSGKKKDSLLEGDSRDFKVRIVERLT